ncbi:hypothetical protein FB645_005666 [Coemansia sp. IMI 203386]|nr:hypothetical protein FB645_005666 [Coemansia sp. IMI 203386]
MKNETTPTPSTAPLPSDMYKKHLPHTTTTLNAALAQYAEYKAEYQELQKTLQTLPDQPHYDALIPVGPLAFFLGQLVHTNEILVLLGENLFAERSAKQAEMVAKRREIYADEKIAELQMQLDAMKKDDKQVDSGLVNEDGERIVDIKEEVKDGELAFGEETSAGGDPGVGIDDELRAKRERAISAATVSLDKRQLGAEERRFLEAIERYTDDEEDEESEEEAKYEDVDGSDHDAFSDEDRANAARDDDEDDYNDGGYAQSDDEENNEAVRPAVIERVFESQPSAPIKLKGILKPMTPISLFKQRRKANDDNPSDRNTRTVRFNIPVDQAATGIEQMQENDDVPNKKKHQPLVFAPNAAKMSGKRSPSAVAEQSKRPIKQTVVERSMLREDERPTLESVDDDLHAKEIAQAYVRMRHARMATGKMDGAAELAERVLATVPGVTLVDRPGDGGDAIEDDKDNGGFERIELASDPSPYNMQQPPEVVHQDAAPKPKMSRFKAKRLGLQE